MLIAGNHKEDQQRQQAGLCEVDRWAVKEGTTFRLALMQHDMTMSEELGRIFGQILLRPSAASKQAAVVRSDSGGGGATSQHLCEPQHSDVKERKVQGMKMNNKEGQQLDSSSQIMTDEESEVEMERMRGITLEAGGGGGYGMLLTPGSQRGIMATAVAAGSHAHQALMAGHRGSSSAFKGSADAHSNRSSSGIGSPESDPHLVTREGSLLLMPPRLRTARRPHHGGGGGGNTSLLSPIHDEMMKDDDDGVMYCDQQQQLLPLLPADDDDLMFIGGHADEEVAYRKQPCLEGSRRSIKQDHDHGDQKQRGLLSFGQGLLEDLLPNEDTMPVHDNIGSRLCDRPDVTNDESYREAAVAARYWSHPSYPSHPSDPAFKLAESYGTGTQQIKQNTVSGDNGGIMSNTTLMVLRIIKGRLVQKQRMTRQMKNVTAASDCSSRQKGHLMTNKEDAASGYDDDHDDDDMDVQQQQQQSSDDTTVSFFELVKGLRRYEAIKLFYQLMCTHTTSYIKVQQDTSYGDLHISAGPLLT
ncbi:hypothetical protein CEUSTIGMA_g8611.t1 [Chlamydomonas eustigma]|uniref:Rad21/Rec8-like protein C-terminal eukaryotic domain-containing protein n=1 Tax=Chlamydomonas eustigma TaxID=1157962 RepID=A0A250XDL4_9CHLO|nr:hypothetical protein CEUSTIGMA_g8611.t1 [Chlamydomonas eustigma]|eukprot:GAX81178.1 hypothetical protein CEUSTIGMA_g8611.t1 [Chlamydomonas eustigma]